MLVGVKVQKIHTSWVGCEVLESQLRW